MMSLRKVFVKNKILFRIRIRIMILLWILIPDLHFIHRRHPPNFVWIRLLHRKLLCPHEKSTYVRTSRQTDGRTDGIFFGLFYLLRHKNHKHLSKGENFFFHSCYYNTFSFYILRMWWESKNTKKSLRHKTKFHEYH